MCEQHIKELKLIADKSKLKKIRNQLLDKLNNMCDNIDMHNVEDVIKITNTINALDDFLNVDNVDNVDVNNKETLYCRIPHKAINTKEDIQTLKGLTIGNEEYEDWQLIKKAFRVCIIEKLLK